MKEKMYVYQLELIDSINNLDKIGSIEVKTTSKYFEVGATISTYLTTKTYKVLNRTEVQ